MARYEDERSEAERCIRPAAPTDAERAGYRLMRLLLRVLRLHELDPVAEVELKGRGPN